VDDGGTAIFDSREAIKDDGITVEASPIAPREMVKEADTILDALLLSRLPVSRAPAAIGWTAGLGFAKLTESYKSNPL